MKAAFIFALIVVGAVATSPAWEAWKEEYGKSYDTSAEESLRFANFVASQKRVASLNANPVSTATFGLGPFADLTEDEFAAKYLMPNHPKPDYSRGGVYEFDHSLEVPDAFSWQGTYAVNPVRNQGQCGSCYAFSTVEEISSSHSVYTGKNESTIELSPQQIVDCNSASDGCGGGDTPNSYEYIVSVGGIESEADYPYTGMNGNCKFDKSKVAISISGFNYATQSKNAKEVQQALVTKGPQSVCLAASRWMHYESGVFKAIDCFLAPTDHCVQLVGYNMAPSSGDAYWIVRNSWGTSWGQEGYIWLEAPEDTCHVLDEVTYATF